MPQADPNRSFEAASRHLFRHINDVDALRSNPLVSAFFLLFKGKRDDNAILLELHSKILSLARNAVREEPFKGTEARARREEQIVAALCGGESWQGTATRLGLSERQYYRERRAICETVSRRLVREPGAVSASLEPNGALRFLLARSDALIDQGFPLKAACVLEDASASLPEGSAKCAVHSALARALLSSDLPHRASERLNECIAKAAALQDVNELSDWVQDHITYTKALIAREKGDHVAATSGLEKLAKRCIADQRADEEAVAVVLDCGVWYGVNGAFDKARVMLNQARQLNRKLPHTVPRLEINLMLLAARCAGDPNSEFSLQCKWLSEAKAYSLAIGSAQGAIDAIDGLLDYSRNNDEIYSLSEEGLRIAKATESVLLLQIVSNQIIQGMLHTPRWRAVDPLIFEIETFLEPASFQWAMLRRLQGIFFRRAGQLKAAIIALKDALSFLQSADNQGLMALILHQLALSQNQSGEVADSVDSIRRAVQLAEGHSNASSLCAIYETAARLLKDRRFGRLARQARATLAIRNADASDSEKRCSAAPQLRLTLDQWRLAPYVRN
jgi:tetratricopeptide (TPR) repeat protein